MLEPRTAEDHAFWTEMVMVRDIVQKTDAAVRMLEQRHKQRSVALDTSYQQSFQRMMQVVMRAWFESQYCLPGPHTVRPVRVARGDLLGQLNRFLSQLELPHVQKRDQLWAHWFLLEVLQLSEQERCTGKMVLLEQRWSPASLHNLATNTQSYITTVQQYMES